MSFKRINFLARMRMSEEELSHYYRELRRYMYLKNEPVKGIKWRKAVSKISMLLLRIDRILTGRKLVLYKDNRIDTNRPHIYACSHVGRYDIESAMEAIGRQSYFVMGDAGETYRNLEGLFLDFQGRIAFDTGYQVSKELINRPRFDIKDSYSILSSYLDYSYADPDIIELYLKYGANEFIIDVMKKDMNLEHVDTDKLRLVLEYNLDRHVGLDTCIKYAQAGADILIYPEGAWNLSPNQLTQKLFTGTATISKMSNADIIPIGIIKRGKKYIVSIGSNIDPDKFESVEELTSELRDRIATLKWEIIEKEGQLKRTELSSNALQEYVDEIMSETSNGYTIDVIEASKYVDSMPTYDEVFEPIKKLSKKS
jgi:1-acyl-sn-glycerol-3-phosphate acyltransferase